MNRLEDGSEGSERGVLNEASKMTLKLFQRKAHMRLKEGSEASGEVSEASEDVSEASAKVS